MHAVFKWEIPIMDEFQMSLPVDALLLEVEVQRGTPCLWALVDTDAKTEIRCFRLAGTGHPIDNAERLVHVGTFLMEAGALVFHLFEVVEEWE